MMLRIEISKLIHWRVSLWLKERECIAADVANLQVSHQCQWWQEIRQWWSKQGSSGRCLCIQHFFECSFVAFPDLLQSTVGVLSRQVGNYNVLLQSCPVELYDADHTTWGSSASNKLREKTCETPLRPPRNNHTRNSRALLQPSLGSW